jgi:hypothetical protein
MKLLLENWRIYQKEVLLENFNAWEAPDILTEEIYLLEEGKIVDFIKKGFQHFFAMPEKFQAMIEEGEKIGPEMEQEALLKLSKNPEFVAGVEKIAAAINQKYKQNPEVISEWKILSENTSSETDVLNKVIQQQSEENAELRKELDKLKAMAFNADSDALIEAAETVTGKTAPPGTKEFLKFILKAGAGKFIFGFIDNFIMVCVGGFIDTYLKAALGIGTLTAAGIGNGISDAVADKGESTMMTMLGTVGLNPDEIAPERMENAPGWMKFLNNNYSWIAIFIGCIVGMFPLLPGIGIGGGLAVVGLGAATGVAKVKKAERHAKWKDIAAGKEVEE